MTIETVNFCPLGATCESIKDGVIQKCMWHVKLVGKDPQTDELRDEWGCAMAWTPLLLIENSRQQLSTASAVESLRNNVVQINSDNRDMLINATRMHNARLIQGE